MDLLASGLNQPAFTNGLHLPVHPARHASQERDIGRAASNYADWLTDEQAELIGDFRTRRSAQRRLSNTTAFGGDVYAAIPRFYSPVEYFQQSQIPYDISVDKQRFELYKWLDLFYRTHYLIPILVDIFTRFPLVGIDLFSPDEKLKEFYEDLFFDRLDYEHFLVDMGREYWTLGQTFPLGSFSELLGIWEDEELIDPTIVKIDKMPIVGSEELFILPPDDLVEIAKNKAPAHLYGQLVTNFPQLIPYLVNKKDIPVSPVLLKQVAFKASRRDKYGTPILLRALRTLMHEEKLMASQDAIAERLYSPLILAKLGVAELGANRMPWIPGPNEIASLRNDLDVALSSDFRLLVHHFGIEVQNVFGREQMPRLDTDFDRVERRIMQVFGVNPSLLSAGSGGQPYASSALQAEFLNQMLRTFQKFLIRHYEARARIVAEAQGHYAYEKRGDQRIPIMEEILVTDEDGTQRIEQRNKLMIPEMRMRVLDLRDEATQRQFLQALKQQGVPIPDQDIAMGMHYDFEESLDRVEEEMVQKTVAQQDAKLKSYKILQARGLPIPPDLKQEIEGSGLAGAQPGEGETLNVNAPQVGQPIVMPDMPDGGGVPPIGPRTPDRGNLPEESTERMPGVTGPQMPGVPGQPGAMGIPGAPQPAIQPASHVEVSVTPRVSRTESAIIYRLPKPKGEPGGVEWLRQERASATLDDDGYSEPDS